jgi:hypothetical protein
VAQDFLVCDNYENFFYSFIFLTASATVLAIHWSKAEGIICSRSGFFTKFAKALAAAILCSSLI